MTAEILTGLLTGLFGAFLFACWKFLKRNFDQIDKSIEKVDDKIDKVDDKVDILKDGTSKISERLFLIKEKIDTLWKERIAISASPLSLNDRGKKILARSGIKEIIDDNIDSLYSKIKEKNPRNAFYVQEFSLDVVYKIKKDKSVLPKLETGAYSSGVDIDTILFVGSIYLRDLMLPKFNCKVEDIDTHKVKKRE